MSVFNYGYSKAASQFTESRYSRWYSPTEDRKDKVYMTERLGGVFKPAIEFENKINHSDKIFTIGSCFARGLERAAHRAKMHAISLRTQSFLGNHIVTGFVNRYNTAAISSELRWAAGIDQFDPASFIERQPGKFIDPHSHPVSAAKPIEEIRNLRNGLKRYFEQALTADVITITLGLIESWHDKETGKTLNLMPAYGRNDNQGRKLIDGERFEFKVMSYEENMTHLEDIYSILKRYNPKCKIIITVSPVPLSATFSHRDVAIANMMSKATLRSCAEAWVGLHPDIQYYPSYEMAVMSDPKLVYKEDCIHIQDSFVDQIMGHFMSNCVHSVPPTICSPARRTYPK